MASVGLLAGILSGYGGKAMVAQIVEAAPARYDTQSTYHYNVQSGKNVADFELTGD